MLTLSCHISYCSCLRSQINKYKYVYLVAYDSDICTLFRDGLRHFTQTTSNAKTCLYFMTGLYNLVTFERVKPRNSCAISHHYMKLARSAALAEELTDRRNNRSSLNVMGKP